MMAVTLFISLLQAALYVSATQFREGDLRLVGGSYQWEGRVEIYMSGSWGTITDSDWTISDAQALCYTLGYFKPGARAFGGAYFGQGSGPIHLDHIVCSGTEYNLTECETGTGTRQSSHSEDVGVKCSTVDENYRNWDIRLEGGRNNWEGRVEVFLKGVWGTIISSNWNTAEALVVCTQLGLSTAGVIARPNAYFGQSNKVIVVSSIDCNSGGTNTNISQCDTEMNQATNHRTEVGVQCGEGSDYKSGDIRLVGGRVSWEGRVELYLNGEWGTITDDSADYRDAHVVCRQLGYDTRRSLISDISYRNAYFGEGIGAIHLNYLYCTGVEYRLINCRYSISSDDHYEDWGIICKNDAPDNGEVRLYYNYYNVDYYRGLLLVYLNDTWGTVSDSSYWTFNDATVVCRQLSRTALSTTSSYYYNRDSLPVKMSRVECVGNETKLIDCQHMLGYSGGSPHSPVSTRCYSGTSCKYGEMRLFGGTTNEGRVEMCNSQGKWSTICDNHWTLKNTKVACATLGYSSEEGSYNSSFVFFDQKWQTTLLPQLDYVRCQGNEVSLRGCVHFSHSYSQCTHNDDVGIRCSPAPCDDGDVKLVYGSNESEGFVLICHNRRWGTLCEQYYSSVNWMVTCNQLGFSGGSRFYYYSNGLSVQRFPTPQTNLTIHCTGKESRLFDCYYRLRSTTECNVDMTVTCQLASCTDGEVRLVEGESEMEGRVEICFSRRWGTISGDGWTYTESTVVCNDLGYEPSGEDYSVRPATNSMPVYMKNVKCTGRELSLLECGYRRNLTHTSHLTDVSVKCKNSECEDGDLRLWRGNSDHHGLLQVCFNKRWGTVNADGWTDKDTRVACRQLKFFGDGGKYSTSAVTKLVNTPIHMDNVGCHGTEDKLIECGYHTDTSEDSHSDDVWIDCSNTTNTMPTSTVSSTKTLATTLPARETYISPSSRVGSSELVTNDPSVNGHIGPSVSSHNAIGPSVNNHRTVVPGVNNHRTIGLNENDGGRFSSASDDDQHSLDVDVGLIMGVISFAGLLLLSVAFVIFIIITMKRIGLQKNLSVRYKKSTDGSEEVRVTTNDPDTDYAYAKPPQISLPPPQGPPTARNSTGMYQPLTIRALDEEASYATLNQAVPRKKDGGSGTAGQRSLLLVPPRGDIKTVN